MNLLNKNKKGFTLSELIAVLVILSIVISLASVIYINVREDALEADYQNVKISLEEVARKYASDTNITVVSVEDLIKAGYITPDDGSDIYDPRTNTSMNCFLIYTKFVDGEYVSELRDVDVGRDANGNCSSYAQSSNNICKVSGNNCEDIKDNTWFNDNVTLGVKYDSVLLKDGDASFLWSSNYGDSSSSATVKTDVSLLGKITYKCEVDTGVNKITATKTVNIDKEKPIITNLKYNTSVTEGKDVTIVASDGNGSGIKEYALVLSDEQCEGNYQESANFSIDLNGDYKACVTDKVGNKSEEKIFKINTIKPGVPKFILKYENADGEEYDGSWTNKDVYLLITSKMNNTMRYEYKKDEWKEIDKEKGGVLFEESATNLTVTVRSCLEDVCGDISTAKNIRIDKIKPTISGVVYSTELTTSIESVKINATDSGGSGLKEYAIVSADESCDGAYNTTNNFKINKNGSYKACVIDGAGNKSENEFTFEVTNIVPGPPTIETYYNNASGSTYSGNWTTQNVYVKITPHATADETNTSYQYKIGDTGRWFDTDLSGFTISSNTDAKVYVRSCNTSTNACNSTTSNGKQIRIDKNKPTIYAKSSSNSATYGSSYVTSNYFTVSYSKSGGYVSCSPSNVSRMSTGKNYVSCTAYGNNGLSSSAYTYVTVSESIPSKPKVTMYYHSSGAEYNGGRSTESIDIHFYSAGASYYNYYYCTGCTETATYSTSTTRSEDIDGYIYVEACNSNGKCSSYTKADIWIEKSSGGGSGGGSSASISCNPSAAYVIQKGIYLSMSRSGCSAYGTMNYADADIEPYIYPFTVSGGQLVVTGISSYNDSGVHTTNWKKPSCVSGYCMYMVTACVNGSSPCATFTYYLKY